MRLYVRSRGKLYGLEDVGNGMLLAFSILLMLWRLSMQHLSRAKLGIVIHHLVQDSARGERSEMVDCRITDQSANRHKTTP
jgi:hypothetical protein